MTVSMPFSGKRSASDAVAMDVDEAAVCGSSDSLVASVQQCFGSREAFDTSSMDAKIQTLALLGSIDFNLVDLERDILVPTVMTQIVMALESVDAGLAVETAACLKNLMTNEHLGSKCTRRLYALCIFPVLSGLLARMTNEDAQETTSWTASMRNSFLESLAVQMWCIAVTVPAALPQINASALVPLLASRLAGTDVESVAADNALLQALLVAVEDNAVLGHAVLAQSGLCEALLAPTAMDMSVAMRFNHVLRLACLVHCVRATSTTTTSTVVTAARLSHIVSVLFATLQMPLPESSLFETEATAVKQHFEMLELAGETLEVAIVEHGADRSMSKCLRPVSWTALHAILVTLHGYWQTHFRVGFAEEANRDRRRVVQYIWSVMGTLLSTQEQLLLVAHISLPDESVLVRQTGDVLRVARDAPSPDYGIADEASGWLRAWLSVWSGDCLPALSSSSLLADMDVLFFCSSSPVVLTNVCAIVALLIPYVPADHQASFCVLLNSLLCTDPFDADHLEILLAAVDAVTGVFDPQSREWPAKPLDELKQDLTQVQQRLNVVLQHNSADDRVPVDAIRERLQAVVSLLRIL